MPLEHTIRHIQKKQEEAYPSYLHVAIMRRVRMSNPLLLAVAWCAVTAVAFFGVFSGWRLASSLADTQAFEFLTIAAGTLSSDMTALPLFTETAFTFIPADLTLYFFADVALLIAGIFAIRRMRAI